MKCKAKIEITTRYPRNVLESIEPDNLVSPRHVSIECRETSRGIECKIIVRGCEDPKRVLTLRNTIDDLLMALKASLSVIDKIDSLNARKDL
ncbi:MAG: hypothetical protein GSR72_07800 [Desulfurococcales archaeon]|nr:hypothetical protein [Desulfurococcales archaeon]